jgi:hypothetical protein
VEITKFDQTKKITESLLKCQDNADFFYVDPIVYREFVPPAQSVNQQFYLNVLKRLHENLGRKHPGKWQGGDWFLHHDNAPAHTALSVQHLWLETKRWLCPIPLITQTCCVKLLFVPTDEAGFDREAFC